MNRPTDWVAVEAWAQKFIGTKSIRGDVIDRLFFSPQSPAEVYWDDRNSIFWFPIVRPAWEAEFGNAPQPQPTSNWQTPRICPSCARIYTPTSVVTTWCNTCMLFSDIHARNDKDRLRNSSHRGTLLKEVAAYIKHKLSRTRTLPHCPHCGTGQNMPYTGYQFNDNEIIALFACETCPTIKTHNIPARD